MIRLGALIAAITASIVLWHECGEDVGVFCYRIGLGALTALRSRTLIPIHVVSNQYARDRRACSNTSSNFSTRSTARMDFES